MRMGVFATIVVTLCGFIQASGAVEASWQTVRAAGDPRITIDIPARVAQRPAADLKKDEDMEFAADYSGTKTGVICNLTHNAYDPRMPQKQFAALIGSVVSRFCTASDVSDFRALSSKPAVSSGYPAGICASTFTNSSVKKPGIVKAVLVVSAPSAAYFLECNVFSAARQASELAWGLELEQFVGHVQSSLHLPSEAR